MKSPLLGAFVLVASVLSASCASSKGSALMFSGDGAPEEDLVEAVQRAQGEIAEAKQDYATALNLFQRLTAPQAVELEDLADDFQDARESCDDRADDLADRIEKVTKESDELFSGWSAQLQQFSGDAMRKKSEAMMVDTQARSQRVLEALKSLQERMVPVQRKLTDYALFFDHNLNPRAIATLQDTYKEFDSEFDALQSELSRAERDVAEFLASFRRPEPAK